MFPDSTIKKQASASIITIAENDGRPSVEEVSESIDSRDNKLLEDLREYNYNRSSKNLRSLLDKPDSPTGMQAYKETVEK